MTKPILLLDVDGVINALGRHDTKTGGGWTIGLPDRIYERFQVLKDMYDIVWATAWEHNANTEIAPLLGLYDEAPNTTCLYCGFTGRDHGPFGLKFSKARGACESYEPREGILPVIEFTSRVNPRPDKSWKLPDVERFANREGEGRAIVWLDDDHPWDARRWADLRNRHDAPTLLVTPNPRAGVGAKEFDELVEFALANTPSSTTTPVAA